jgi:cation:H+ antiporter
MFWVTFLLSAAVIVIVGTKLSHYGDQIAEYSGLGRLWIGVVLLAGATSLPEVFTTVSAALLNAPDLAVGNLFGACMSNMLTFGLIDLLHRQRRLWRQTTYEHILSASLATALACLAALFVLLRTDLALWNVGLDSLFIAIIYIVGMRVVYRQEALRQRQKEFERVVEAEAEEDSAKPFSRAQMLRHASVRFTAAAIVIIIAAPFLAASAKEIADRTGIGTTFVGSFLVAVTTSLPELVTALAAVRLGAFDLAVGNLFGSNAFNMGALLFTDVAYRPGPLLSVVSSTHVVTAFFAILLMNIGIMGIIYRAEKRFLLLEPDSVLMILSYAVGMWALFRLGGG